VKFNNEITGRQLFEQDHKSDINAKATQLRESTAKGGPFAGFYQSALKEMWEQQEDKDGYEARAKDAKADIFQYVIILWVDFLN